MPTAAEKHALAFLTAVALMGGGARVWQSRHLDANREPTPSAEGEGAAHGESVDAQLAAVNSAASARGRNGTRDKSHARTKLATALIDVNAASAEELEKLPRIGTALAKRIVANRDSFGAFGGLDDLGRVRGLGVAMREVLSAQVTFLAMPQGSEPRRPDISNAETQQSQSRKRRNRSQHATRAGDAKTFKTNSR